MLLFCGSVWLERLERGQCRCLVSIGLPSTCPISSHFIHFPYVTGALLAIALMVILKVGGFSYILSPWGPLKALSWETKSLFCCPTPHLFLQAEVMKLYSSCWNSELYSLAWGWDHLIPCYCSWFLSTTCECGTTHSTTVASPYHSVTSLPQLCNSAPLTHLDEYGFFKSLVVGFPYSLIFWLFWVIFILRLAVILFMVVQGSKACLLTPPSWLEVC